MKILKLMVAVVMALSIVTLSACTTTVRTTTSSRATSKPLPPGQAIKISGDKSAKHHAPGHNK
ncbi:MAG TPA: hypothetical protein VF677_12830 [Flavobacterium sp.]|jgi:maltose-binding protein MalE